MFLGLTSVNCYNVGTVEFYSSFEVPFKFVQEPIFISVKPFKFGMFIVSAHEASTVLTVSTEDLSAGLERLGTTGLAGQGRYSTFDDVLGDVHEFRIYWQMSTAFW